MELNKSILIVNSSMSPTSELLSHQYFLAMAIRKRYPLTRILTTEVEKDASNILSFTTKISWRKGLLSSLYNSLAFLTALRSEIKKHPCEYVFFHMTPIQAALATPYLKLAGIKTSLWYAHKAKPISLKISRHLVNVVMTPGPGSISIECPNLVFTGHHVDEEFFKFDNEQIKSRRAVVVGRLDSSKRIDLIIDVLRPYLIETKALDQIVFIGTSSSEVSKEGLSRTLKKNRDLINHGQVLFLGPRDRSEILDTLRTSLVLINASLGSLDKSVLEAVFTKTSIITTIPDFLSDFGPWADSKDRVTLQKEVDIFFESSELERKLRAEENYKIALKKHSLTNWLDKFSIAFIN